MNSPDQRRDVQRFQVLGVGLGNNGPPFYITQRSRRHTYGETMACWVKYLLLLPFLYMDRFFFPLFFFLNNLFKIKKKRKVWTKLYTMAPPSRWRWPSWRPHQVLPRETTGGRASHFQRCIGPLPYYVCCVLFFFSTLDGSVSLSSLARAGFVFTFSLSFILIREKKKKKEERHRPKLDVFPFGRFSHNQVLLSVAIALV